MNYEKAYKEAIERCKSWMMGEHHECFTEAQKAGEFIFPELKESEDERIRKMLIRHITQERGSLSNDEAQMAIDWLEKQKPTPLEECVFRPYVGGSIESAAIQAVEQQKLGKKVVLAFNGAYIPVGDKTADDIVREYDSWCKKQSNIPHLTYDDILALQCAMKTAEKADNELYEQLKSLHDRLHDAYWLEKQSERNSIDNVEPKFKNGKWIVWQGKCYKVNYNGCGYELVDQNGLITSLEYSTIDENAHLWDIAKDAKDGDIIVNDFADGTCIAIFKSFTNGKTNIYCHLVNNDYFCPKHGTSNAKWHPAQKEQRNHLLQKIKEEGYEWNIE